MTGRSRYRQADWLRDAPADFPEWQRSAFEAVRPTWLEQAAVIEAEINDAIRALRRHGFLPGPGEMEDSEYAREGSVCNRE